MSVSDVFSCRGALTPAVLYFGPQVILSYPTLSFIFLLTAVAAIRRYIRDSHKVDGFRDKHVFITGCDSGFGNLLARQLDGKGFQVIAACLTEKGAADLRAAASTRLKTVQLNVTDSESIRKAVEFVRREVKERGEGGCWWGCALME